jgi:hypothetical protein
MGLGRRVRQCMMLQNWLLISCGLNRVYVLLMLLFIARKHANSEIHGSCQEPLGDYIRLFSPDYAELTFMNTRIGFAVLSKEYL